jgi:hypothetical protein
MNQSPTEDLFMRASFVLTAAIAGVFLAGNVGGEVEATAVDRHAIGHRAEVQRIQAHFDSVLSELRARDVDALTLNQRTERAKLIGVLVAYRDRGVFPHNRDFAEAIPYFIDRPTGTLCAVAHLLESTGRRDIVDAVAAMDNNVWVNDLADNREFERWLDRNGLTLAEAARIQVPYVGDGVGPEPQVSALYSRRTSTAVVGGTAAVSLWNAFANRNGQQGIASLAGIATGAVAAGYGGAVMASGDAPRSIGALSIAAGGVSAFLATRGFLRQRHLAADAKKAQLASRTTVTPFVPLDGQRGAGLSVSIKF